MTLVGQGMMHSPPAGPLPSTAIVKAEDGTAALTQQQPGSWWQAKGLCSLSSIASDSCGPKDPTSPHSP